MTSKKLYIKTYGCQMNVYDSDRMAEVLGPLGYGAVDAPDEADLIILNTCHIREKASEKVYSEVGRLRALKEQRAAGGERVLIAVGGCVAQAQGAEMFRRAPAIDIVFGPQTYQNLPGMIEAASETPGARVMDTEFTPEEKFDALPAQTETTAPSAFLTIQEGCDKFCTFCVVPYTRGAEYSRPVADIYSDAARLTHAGVREITLLGQNVNAYRGVDASGSESGLGELLRRLAEIGGLERLRYTTSHPRDVDTALIEAHRDVPQLMPFLHLPVQSGSDTILAAMNRRHTADDYYRIVESLRSARPDLALSSDFIVGFPGESDADFEATMRLVREVRFAQAYSFKYSSRPGTPAAEMGEQVPEAVKSERLEVLQMELAEQQTAFNRNSVGLRMPVLFERLGRHPGQIVGRTPYMQAINVEVGAGNPSDFLGQLHEVEVRDVLPNSLAGRLSTSQAHAAQ